MYNCPTCGHEISVNAPICFNCGETAWGRQMPGVNLGGNDENGCALLLGVLAFAGFCFFICSGLLYILPGK